MRLCHLFPNPGADERVKSGDSPYGGEDKLVRLSIGSILRVHHFSILFDPSCHLDSLTGL